MGSLKNHQDNFDEDTTVIKNNKVRDKLKTLYNSYSGQRCFIMGNGPSINLMDLELLKDEVVWGFNKCYLLFDRLSWRPRFYITNDYRLTKDIAIEINQLIQESTITIFFFPTLFNKNKLLKSSPKIYLYNEKNWRNSNRSQWLFSQNASYWVAKATTVTIAGLQLATYLGFNPIYLIGCDTTYSIPSTVIFEDSPKNLISTQNDDPNHFSPNYFSKGDKWSLPDVDLMIYQYEQSKKFLDEVGVYVYNATIGGHLEIFPRVRFDSLFGK